MHETYGANPRLLPQVAERRRAAAEAAAHRHEPRDELGGRRRRARARRQCPFEYASRLTETMLLGVVACKAGTKIHYDGENMRVTNNAAANDFLKREYRQGWATHKKGEPGKAGGTRSPPHEHSCFSEFSSSRYFSVEGHGVHVAVVVRRRLRHGLPLPIIPTSAALKPTLCG